ncbi:ABC transporter permease [Amycolatopsis sp. NPDC059090]|uniref:ABC transporter permease n=1 Tax=unclassified Amycolatopsis TaxID=2618356 RepID=UPI003670725E
MRGILRWLLSSAVLVLVVSALTFVLVSLTPGDAARSILGASGTEAQHEQLRHQLGLDRPLWTRYGEWLNGVLHGDLGTSLFTGQPVSAALNERLGVTLTLIVGSMVVAIAVGGGLGLLSAVRGGRIGRTVDVFSLLGLAIPNFWLGLVLVAVFAVALRVFPTGGYVAMTQSPAGWLGSIVLPVVTLGFGASAMLAKQSRDAVLDELGKDYVVMLRARAVGERSVILRHVLKNAAVPIVTVLGLLFVGLLGGSVFVETLFVLPGLGSTVVQATTTHDIPMVQGVALYFTVIVVAVNLVVELTYRKLNHRSGT